MTLIHQVVRSEKNSFMSKDDLWDAYMLLTVNVKQWPLQVQKVFGSYFVNLKQMYGNTQACHQFLAPDTSTSSWISRILWSMCVDDTIVMTPPDYLHHLTIRCPVRGSLLQARVGNQRPWLIREKSVQNTPIFSGYLEFDFFIIKSKYLEAFPRHIESSSEGSGEITRYFFNMALALWGI